MLFYTQKSITIKIFLTITFFLNDNRGTDKINISGKPKLTFKNSITFINFV